MSQEVYTNNEQKAVSETLEGEAMIINLETGSYYNLNPVASVLWNLLSARHAVSDIVDHLQKRYEGLAEESIRTFIEMLKAEGLIIASDTSVTLPLWEGEKEHGEAPMMKRYDDMQEMLLADPIHDVGPGGWPILKEEQ